MRKNLGYPTALLLSMAMVGCAPNDVSTVDGPTSATRLKGGRPGSTALIYVTSQGLCYSTFLARDPLPMHGPFQLLTNARTEFGPGDPGYHGGRWWEDTNHNGIQDPDDHFFLAPLLPPGRPCALP